MSNVSMFLPELAGRRFKIAFLLAQRLEEEGLVHERFLDHMQLIAEMLDGSCGDEKINKGYKNLAMTEQFLIKVTAV